MHSRRLLSSETVRSLNSICLGLREWKPEGNAVLASHRDPVKHSRRLYEINRDSAAGPWMLDNSRCTYHSPLVTLVHHGASESRWAFLYTINPPINIYAYIKFYVNIIYFFTFFVYILYYVSCTTIFFSDLAYHFSSLL
jgi:hypothetical protein